jgi:hypothetical protein
VKPFGRPLACALFFAAAAAFAGAADVVVLKGGTVIPLKGPVVRRGNTAYITRADGTLLSVPASEIDRDATAAANHAPPPAAPVAAAPATNPADAARMPRDGQKAKVRITDADVSHQLDLDAGAAPDKGKKEAATSGAARVEVGDYTREKNGATLVVKGSVRNPGQGPAENVHMNVTAIDEKGQPIDGTTASLSNGTVAAGASVEFNASLNIGDKTVASLRFQPQWTTPPPPPQSVKPGAAGPGGAASADNAAPAPRPTPYGRGTLYAAPVANASTERPTDSNTGYLPNVSSPDNQPKPPQR